jgi:hypothetical protein
MESRKSRRRNRYSVGRPATGSATTTDVQLLVELLIQLLLGIVYLDICCCWFCSAESAEKNAGRGCKWLIGALGTAVAGSTSGLH